MDRNPKSQEDEEFEMLLRDFIDGALDAADNPDDHDDQYDENLPFPRPRPPRFTSYIYTNDYYPVCEGDGQVTIQKGRKLRLPPGISCRQVWLPGQYVLIVRDSQDHTSVMRYDFTLDDKLRVIHQTAGRRCMAMSLEDTLSGCLKADNDNWYHISRVPGTAPMRMKAIRACQMLYINEYRKEKSHGELKTCLNLLICMDHPTPDFLSRLQLLVASDYESKIVDSAMLFDPTRNNPYELLPDLLDDCDMKVLCLTRLTDLIGPNGKIIMRKIIDKVRRSEGSTPLWLCGTRREIEELLGLYPSLKEFFRDDSWVEQQPSTAYELVQAFLDQLKEEHLEPTATVIDELSRAIIQGQAEGALSRWSTDQVRHFVEAEILPRYVGRIVMQNEMDVSPMLILSDIPFEKLTDTASTFERSISELHAMIGLDEVKQGISTMANQARLFLERRRRGLRTGDSQVYHSIFTGNPGTGKTTVARQLGRIYHSLGLLSKGEVIAVDRTRLVGQYIGQTEENMKTVLEEAKGNVLFIDEAYTLFTGSDDSKDFGRRVLDSLLTVLTQPNPDMLIVFAGYEKEMNAMLSFNVGLSGRFPYRYHFDDYTADQLMEIARRLFVREEYVLSDEAAAAMKDAICQTLSRKTANFGNARWIEQFVRNGIIPAMANRIFSTGSTDFQRIEAADVSNAFEKFNPKTIALKPGRKVVTGFSA